MKYVRVPGEIPSGDIRQEGACFSPGRYVRFVPEGKDGKARYESLDKLVIVRKSKVKPDKGETYNYAEIGDIDVATGGVVFRRLRGYQLPTKTPIEVRKNDVLLSTVRTYRGGIGWVSSDDQQSVASNAIMNFCGVTDYVPGLTLQYVYSFLRSDFFIEQVWSLLNRGLYPRVERDALDKILIPIPEDWQKIELVTGLTQAIIDKESMIRVLHRKILDTLHSELTGGRTAEDFHYAHPTVDDIRILNRLDTGLYCREFKSFKHLVDNYESGSTCLSKLGVRSRRGPNLAVSVLGNSSISKQPKPDNWYQLIRPVNITEYGTLAKREWLGTKRKLPLLKKGDIVLGCEGFEKGRTFVVMEEIEKCTTNFHGTVLFWPEAEMRRIIALRCYLAYLRFRGIIDLVGVGGSGGHMSPEYFDCLPIPVLPESIESDIAECYSSGLQPLKESVSPRNLIEVHRGRNEESGIWELDREMRELQSTLRQIQENIIRGEKARIAS